MHGFRTLILSALVLSLYGCALSNQDQRENVAPAKRVDVAYASNAWRVCAGESCPKPTPKSMMSPDVIKRINRLKEEIGPVASPVAEYQEKKVVVHFASGKHQPNTKSMALLKTVTAEIVKGKPIKVVGHTDSDGSFEFNQRLAERRAGYVSEWLKAAGVTNEIKLEASGKCCYVQPNETATGKSKNRRVEIFFSTVKKKEVVQ